ncbi:hypothetical protein [Actinophytocola algeriensis]|uniref:SnoaL-like protein n=1 Tax=Actinophytocola algeriensis TaxID=1768010 RepID=A0A7W7VFL4_9PSEU|nr:hypothetical protein [Actinophytocola algeriensis]MBB4908473.1 hypothetical protein [Actinophytocola algeriensis]MBE1475140.1 hypothetical protein [Actinophytocola algeriensis]
MTGQRRTPAPAAAQREPLTTFVAAARSGDMSALERLLAPDVTSLSDGNGRVRVARRPVVGVPGVTRGLALRQAGRAAAPSLWSVQSAAATITDLWIVLNPAKPRGWHR